VTDLRQGQGVLALFRLLRQSCQSTQSCGSSVAGCIFVQLDLGLFGIKGNVGKIACLILSYFNLECS